MNSTAGGDRHALHVVQVGWDTALLTAGAPSDARLRQGQYSRLLCEKRPGSRMTILVVGASEASEPYHDGNLTVIPIAGRWASVARLPRALSSIAACDPISVIATQSPFEEAWAALAFSRGRVPLIAQVHFDLTAEAALPKGVRLREALGRLRRRAAESLLVRCAAVRTVTPGMAAHIRALGAGDVRCIPVPIPDLDVLATAVRIARDPDAPRILFVGRLAPEKNLSLWLEVARRVGEQAPAARFDIVGDGTLRPELEATAKQLGIADKVTFHGAKGRAELPALFARASVFLLTSDHEGFGRVLIEAMAAGVPVVATRTRGAREVLEEAGVGLLAEPGDAEGLSRAVLGPLSDPAYRTRLAAAAADHVAERYRPEALAAAWVDMLIETVDRHPPHPSHRS